MTWKSHKIVTTTVVFALTNNLLFALIAGLGSIFPDKIEYILYPKENWSKHHRTWSHFWVIYTIISILLYVILKNTHLFIKNTHQFYFMIKAFPLEHYLAVIGMNFIFWYSIGCLFHILEDALCGGIPILNPNKKVKLMHLFYVRSTKEYLFAYGLSIFILLCKFKTIYPALKNWINI